MDLDGESRHEQLEAKLSRRGREMLNEGEESDSKHRTMKEKKRVRNLRKIGLSYRAR